MKKTFLISLLFCCIGLVLHAQDQSEVRAPYKKFNFGAKTGFTSAIFLSTKFKVGDQKINEVQNNYKVGFTGSLFMRYNIKSHYIQPEIAYNRNRSEVYFDKGGQVQRYSPIFSSIRSDMHSIDIPILYGYNFIKEGIYGMSFFVGPKLRYILNRQSDLDYVNFDQQGISENLNRLNFGFTGGVAVYISKIFFDFRYEQTVQNISKSVTYNKAMTPEHFQQELKLNRRDHILSFSLGVMF